VAADDKPLRRLTLEATSVADDVGYVALADLSRVLHGRDVDHRIIGGHMVTVLAARWELGADLHRETGDADLGIPPVVARDRGLFADLSALGYAGGSGHRFTRPLDDVPVRLAGDDAVRREATIDVLVPAYRSRARENQRFGDHLTTVEVLGLATALRRPPVRLHVDVGRLNGDRLDFDVVVPDEVAAVVLKALATHVRYKTTDVVDVWRCLEVAFAAGVNPDEFSEGEPARAADIVRRLFADRHGRGMNDLVAEQRLTAAAADRRYTRIRALVRHVLGRP
jgi:hypothetical protein